VIYRYEAQLESDWQHILKDSGAKMLLVGTKTILDRTRDYVNKVAPPLIG
jgi:hypothetical protein